MSLLLGALPPIPPPRAPPRGMRARAARNLGAMCVRRASRTTLACARRARARSRACAFARAIARASVNAQRKRRTDARCAIARPAPLHVNFPTSVRASPQPCFFLSVQSPRFPFVQSASDILCSPPRLFTPSSSCARSTIPPPPAPVPLPPPCRPFPTPAVLSALAFRLRPSRCRVVLLARASATLSIVTLLIAAVMQ